MYMRDTMHQIDSSVINSFLKAIISKFQVPLVSGTATQHRWGRLQRLLGKQTSASWDIMHGAHACLVPVNYATLNVFKQLAEKNKAA
jgi:hypothetical protein